MPKVKAQGERSGRMRANLQPRDVHRLADAVLENKALVEQLADAIVADEERAAAFAKAYRDVVEEKCPLNDMVHVQVLANQIGVHRRTVTRRCRRYDIPLRNANGHILNPSDRKAQWVHKTEWMLGHRKHGHTLDP